MDGGHMPYEYLYEWKMLDHDAGASEITCFLDFEKKMAEHSIRTRVIPNVALGGFELWIPEKDFEVARALYVGEVRAIIDAPKELYHVFEGDLTFKNKVLYEDKFKVKSRYGRYRSILIIGLIILIMLVIFRFVKVN